MPTRLSWESRRAWGSRQVEVVALLPRALVGPVPVFSRSPAGLLANVQCRAWLTTLGAAFGVQISPAAVRGGMVTWCKIGAFWPASRRTVRVDGACRRVWRRGMGAVLAHTSPGTEGPLGKQNRCVELGLQ